MSALVGRADTRVGPYMTVSEHGRDLIVSIREDIRADLYTLTDGAFDRKAAAVDLRPDVLDDDALDVQRRRLLRASELVRAREVGPSKLGPSNPLG